MTQFTVIVPTRNRPEMFRVALESVLSQQDADFDVIVVHDGSDPEFLPGYQQVFAEHAARIVIIDQARRQRGHGHAYGLNTGAAVASGQYLAFLDDDDQWIDDHHLSRASRAITLASQQPSPDGGVAAPVDMYLSNQEAWSEGKRLAPPIWIENLQEKATNLPPPDDTGSYRVTAADMVRAWGFCHLNTLIMRAEFYAQIKGVDEYLRYECDRDFYFRGIDQAKSVLYNPAIIARHNVPLVGKQANVSTQVSGTEKALYQMLILGRLHLSVHSPELRAYAWRHRAFTLQRMAMLYARAGFFRTALPYAIEGAVTRPSPHWLMHTLNIALAALIAGDRKGVRGMQG